MSDSGNNTNPANWGTTQTNLPTAIPNINAVNDATQAQAKAQQNSSSTSSTTSTTPTTADSENVDVPTDEIQFQMGLLLPLMKKTAAIIRKKSRTDVVTRGIKMMQKELLQDTNIQLCEWDGQRGPCTNEAKKILRGRHFCTPHYQREEQKRPRDQAVNNARQLTTLDREMVRDLVTEIAPLLTRPEGFGGARKKRHSRRSRLNVPIAQTNSRENPFPVDSPNGFPPKDGNPYHWSAQLADWIPSEFTEMSDEEDVQVANKT